MGVLHFSKGPLPLAKLAFFDHFRFLSVEQYRQPNYGYMRKHSCGVSRELIPRGKYSRGCCPIDWDPLAE